MVMMANIIIIIIIIIIAIIIPVIIVTMTITIALYQNVSRNPRFWQQDTLFRAEHPK